LNFSLTPGPSPATAVAGEGSYFEELFLARIKNYKIKRGEVLNFSLTPGPSPATAVSGEGRRFNYKNIFSKKIMISQFVKGKVYVFIDAENLFYSQRNLGWRISYEKLMDYFKKECGEATRCFVYKGIDENNTGQKKFLDMLDINGYVLRTKVVKIIKNPMGKNKWKGNLDIELALEMTGLKDRYNTAVLISGDSDFAIVLDQLKQAGKNVIVMSTRGRVAKELLERAKYIDLRKLKDKIAQKKSGAAPSREHSRVSSHY